MKTPHSIRITIDLEVSGELDTETAYRRASKLADNACNDWLDNQSVEIALIEDIQDLT